ncbi:MAG: hypothetical protein R3183_14395, partial [Oleiphilaceae bacterium]|nr:hypothetical protein [Oleiphilaceae bacterium]
YKTTGWYIRHYLPRLFSLSTWLTFFKKVGQSLPASSTEQSNSPELPEDSRTIPPKQEVVEGYQKLLAGGCRILVIITGGQLYTFNHKEQFRACFNQVDWADKLEEHFYPEAEHILPEPLYQEKVSQNICQWIATFPRATH